MNIEFYLATVIVCFSLNLWAHYLDNDITIGGLILCGVAALIPIANFMLTFSSLVIIFGMKVADSDVLRKVIVKKKLR
jgi:uncharacterized membrane protein